MVKRERKKEKGSKESGHAYSFDPFCRTFDNVHAFHRRLSFKRRRLSRIRPMTLP